MRLLLHGAALALLAACASATPPPPAAPGPTAPAAAASSGTFALLREGDTLATERFTRTAGRLETDLVIPSQVRVHIDARLNPDASVSRLELRTYPHAAADTTAAQVSIAEFRGDSVFVEGRRGDETMTDRRPLMVSGVVPYVNPSPSLMEQIVRRARAMGGEMVEVPVFASSAGGSTVNASVHFAGSTAHLNLGGVEVTLELDESGGVRGGSVPAQGLTLVRMP